MVTRKEKRECEKDTNYFFELEKVRKHFFKIQGIKAMLPIIVISYL